MNILLDVARNLLLLTKGIISINSCIALYICVRVIYCNQLLISLRMSVTNKRNNSKYYYYLNLKINIYHIFIKEKLAERRK